MKVYQHQWTPEKEWQGTIPLRADQAKHLVLAFGNRYQLERPDVVEEIKAFYPDSDVILNSTSGEIIGARVLDNSIVMTAIEFDKTPYKIVQVNIKEQLNSFSAGKKLALQLSNDQLRHVFVISDGGSVNGTDLVEGLNSNLPEKVTTTGGLAGDDARFEKTLVGYNTAPDEGNIIAIGLYGEALQIGYGSVGGWIPFGPERVVTKSKGNVLYELDGQSALSLYKRYLGDKAAELPGSALLFPLSIKSGEDDKVLVRTILSIDEEEGAMIFAGDIPEGVSARLMKANFDKLVDGAYEAANVGMIPLDGKKAELAILVSCVGRKLVLGPRIEEEVEVIEEIIGPQAAITGFYSYGEIAPFAGMRNCALHNQTMTVTLLSEN